MMHDPGGLEAIQRGTNLRRAQAVRLGPPTQSLPAGDLRPPRSRFGDQAADPSSFRRGPRSGTVCLFPTQIDHGPQVRLRPSVPLAHHARPGTTLLRPAFTVSARRIVVSGESDRDGLTPATRPAAARRIAAVRP